MANSPKLKQPPVSIIFMDCNMPQTDGFKTTQAIAEKCGRVGAGLPHIIALTANSDDDDLRTRCEQHGLQEFFQKPISASQL